MPVLITKFDGKIILVSVPELCDSKKESEKNVCAMELKSH